MPHTTLPAPADIARFLAEDIGSGDLTAAIVPARTQAAASVVTREPLVLCGRDWFAAVFAQLDAGVVIDWRVAEGEAATAGTELCALRGPARALLTGERTALNLLQTLSATATLARSYAQAVAGTKTKVLDTRKTLPGLREAQKYAVRVGGCHNHRIGLYDGILIKENHILAAGSIAQAVAAAKALDAGVMIEVEVEDLDELRQALDAGAPRILLDNFTLEAMREAVAMAQGRAELEVSGNVTLAGLRAIAETGVDYVSVGALTKNVRAVDLSMRIALGA
ncbi:carboxylating nicotinate-nucleotide diphosphorylase [Methylomagnum ishizawai]|uniref:carboxylating nicotinate-nucleotide diphosphorylase n=1 Tax=Methylomagnum ishizawai TaxID=1760988 RepID=UPI001C32A5FB|nr:carboxylating nicotinate-nucleotide diphosphorylase [Methylomagnum ishizawai]BBL76932.1 nicotinate-nucleotide pyrophosphorylase [carboxylating] [Methylomagnum ishizawai]